MYVDGVIRRDGRESGWESEWHRRGKCVGKGLEGLRGAVVVLA